MRCRPWTTCLAAATIAAGPLAAQDLPNPAAHVPDFVGPVDDSAPYPLEYDPELPLETPDWVRAIDPDSPVTGFEEALLRAYWFNPQLLAERANMRAADFTLPQARAAYGPSVSYSLGIDWQRDRSDSIIGSTITRSGQTRSAAAIFNQPLFGFGRFAAGERGARAQIAFQRAALSDAEQRVLFNAVAAYVGLLRDRAALQIAEDNLAILERETRDNEARFEVRETTAPDLRQVETREALARASLLTARSNLATSEASFIAVIGSPPGDLEPPPLLPQLTATLEDALAIAQQQNPLVAAARAREQISRAAMAAAYAERFPRVDLQGRADWAPSSPYDNDRRTNSVQGGIVLSGPIFTSGLLSARQAQAEAANDADWRLIDGALRDLRADVRSSWTRRGNLQLALTPLAEAVEAARAAYDGATVQQRAGFRTTLDVLILARELLDVRNSYNAAIADAYLADARLLAAMGELDAGLLLPGGGHDPRPHLEMVDGYGDIPLWTPVLDALDGLFYAAPLGDRPVRDPALDPLPGEPAG